MSDDINAIKTLIAKGADPTQDHGISNTTVLKHAIYEKKYDVVKELLASPKIDKSKFKGFLKPALYNEDLELCLMLIDRGADINTNDIAKSALYLAAIVKKDKAAVQKLKNHGGLDLTTEQYLEQKMTTVINLLKEKKDKDPVYGEILEILEPGASAQKH